uniref:Outer capsid protein VP2 n=1 Tax=Changuinola virus TaxID=40052 RepID=U5YL16_9REOV|nr:outer capsid protein VP2 [Changuinola virus]
MATEFSLAIVRLDKNRCQDKLMSNFDIVIDTSNRAEGDGYGWSIENEAIRRNIFCWARDRDIDAVIDGLPGNESYVSIPKAIDLVLGMISESNAEDHVLDTGIIKKEIEWDMNMQSQEWTVSGNSWMVDRPKVESVMGDIYAFPHHFETLSYLKMPIERARCTHDNHDVFNQNVFSSLHHIVHNTIYLIDVSYKVIVQDEALYRYPIGVICEYTTTSDMDKWLNGDFYSEKMLLNDTVGYNEAGRTLQLLGDTIIDGEGGDVPPSVVRITKKPRSTDASERTLARTADDGEYDSADSRLMETAPVLLNPSAREVQIKQLFFKNNKMSVRLERGAISVIEGRNAEDIYVAMISQPNASIQKDVISYTNVMYTEMGKHTIGFGPLTVEGEVNAAVMHQWRNDPKMKAFADFLLWNPPAHIDVNQLCKVFGEYSRGRPNNNVRYFDDDRICAKFRLTLNALYNKDGERAKVADGYGDGWKVDPIDVRAFAKIDEFDEPAFKKNPAKLGIIISSVMGGIVTEYCPIHTIRGAFMLANKMFGNVYNLLEDTFQWRIWVAEGRRGWRKRDNPRISPLTRVDVYRSTLKKGWSGVSWQFFWDDDVWVDAGGGYPFFREEVSNSCWFNEEKILKFNQDMINSDDWGEVKYEIDDLLDERGRFRNKDILKDFYLDKYKVLITPWYYGVKVLYNVIANCCYKCVPTTAHDTTPGNKNQFKHSGGQRLLVPNNWFYPFQDQFDEIVICEGKSLSDSRQPRGRLERTYVDAIARNAEFREYIGKTEVEIIETGCPISYTTSYVIWFFYMRLFNVYINYFPIDARKRFQSMDELVPVFPNVKVYKNGYTDEIRSLNEAIYQLLIDAYGAKKLTSNARCIWIKRYQSTSGEAKLKLVKDAVPKLYDQIVSDGEHIDNYFVINFLLLLSTVSSNVALEEDTYAPICYCRNAQLSIFSVKLRQTNKSNVMSQFIGYLTRFYGLKLHSGWRDADTVTKTLRRKAIDFYVGKYIVDLSPNILVNQTKHQNLNLWIGTKCDGFADALIFYQAITHPRASYFIVCICTSNSRIGVLKVELARLLSASAHTSIGYVIIRIGNGVIYDIHVVGELSVRELKRSFWGLTHDVILIKSKGKVFGNRHLVTKLMNIQS